MTGVAAAFCGAPDSKFRQSVDFDNESRMGVPSIDFSRFLDHLLRFYATILHRLSLNLNFKRLQRNLLMTFDLNFQTPYTGNLRQNFYFGLKFSFVQSAHIRFHSLR